MASTPPPPGRVHTPPPPLHGPRHDAYEPYSPRRSARVSAQRDHRRSSPEPGPSRARAAANPHFTISSTPAARKSKLTRTASSQTLSPPSSPELHAKRTPPLQKRFLSARDPGGANGHSGSETDIPKTSLRNTPINMLPTPNKTPRQRNAAAINTTARILNFRPGSLDDVMPNPQKQRRSRLTLDSFDDMYGQEEQQIQIYTDSQDRVPDMEESSDNPFVGPKKTGFATKAAKGKKTKRNLEREGDEADMEEAVRNNEGIVYVFRGKKIFRRFESPAPDEDEDDETDPDAAFTESSTLKRQAGAVAKRPFTRSSLKPRLLFPSEEQRQERETHDDEEAVTDIELQDATDEHDEQDIEHDYATTPAKNLHFTPATPPTSKAATGSTKRRSTRFLIDLADVAESPETEHTSASPASTLTPVPKSRLKKVSPFDSWQRTKAPAAVGAIQSRKRAGDDAEGGAVGKRTRSATH